MLQVKNLINKACLLDTRFKAIILVQTYKYNIIGMVEDEAQIIIPTKGSTN